MGERLVVSSSASSLRFLGVDAFFGDVEYVVDLSVSSEGPGMALAAELVTEAKTVSFLYFMVHNPECPNLSASGRNKVKYAKSPVLSLKYKPFESTCPVALCQVEFSSSKYIASQFV